MVELPLAVWEGEKVPQFGALPHTATQSTPALAVSLLTVAETEAEVPTVREEGGAWTRATEMIGGGGLTVLALFEEQPLSKVPRTIGKKTR